MSQGLAKLPSSPDTAAGRLLSLFTSDVAAAECLERDARWMESLRVSVRVTVEFAYFLRELPVDMSPREPRVDHMRDTISSAIPCFDEMRDLEEVLATRHPHVFEWPHYAGIEPLKDAFGECLGAMLSEDATTGDRLHSLLQGIRLQLLFWATSFH